MNAKQNFVKKPHGLKCLKCPYYLGLIKCIVNPCIDCVLTGQKTSPFEFVRRVVLHGHKSQKHEE